jgi:hypothetical protein
MEQDLSDAKERTPSSRVLEDILDQAPDYFTLGSRCRPCTSVFGLVMLLLGLLAHGEEKGRRS